jgi:hypothetical protein
LDKLLLRQKLVVFWGRENLVGLKFLNELCDEVAVFGVVGDGCIDFGENGFYGLKLLEEGFGEISGERGNAVGLSNGILKFCVGDGAFLMDLLDNFNKIISLCFLL